MLLSVDGWNPPGQSQPRPILGGWARRSQPLSLTQASSPPSAGLSFGPGLWPLRSQHIQGRGLLPCCPVPGPAPEARLGPESLLTLLRCRGYEVPTSSVAPPGLHPRLLPGLPSCQPSSPFCWALATPPFREHSEGPRAPSQVPKGSPPKRSRRDGSCPRPARGQVLVGASAPGFSG